MGKKIGCLNQATNEVHQSRTMRFVPQNILSCYSIKLFIIGCFCSVMLIACMYLPAARDDFSVLGDDIFSNLIKEAYSEKVLVSGCDTGECRIDKIEANKIAKKTMYGKTVKEIVALFRQEGGQCSSITQYHNEKLLICNAERKWRLKNIGAPFDTSNWSDPAVKLLYRFSLNSSETITNVELELIDVTEYKEIYTH